MILLLQMFESAGWLLEEPEVNDTSKFDMIFPTVVRPPNSTSVLQAADGIEVSQPRSFSPSSPNYLLYSSDFSAFSA
jgi:cation-transporting ATPase 13A3/4/5